MTHSTNAWVTPDDCRVEDFIELVDEPVSVGDYPYASGVDRGVVIYDSSDLRCCIGDIDKQRAVMEEFVHVLDSGPGVLVLRQAVADRTLLDAVTTAFNQLIEREQESGMAAGDHFAAPGVNDRVWNALEKLALAAPDLFVRYYANDMLALVSQAWLGPGYQVTSQLNRVNPGGLPQSPHRDYHLGFQSQESVQRYPIQVHRMSPYLTLQGAIAHCDMPLETGPTFLVPHSQKYAPGYVAYQLPEFRECAEERAVQVALEAGDAMFFNPALFHGAGGNVSSDVRRLANLLQISSAFGRAMERIDRIGLVNAIYPHLLDWKNAGASSQELRNVVAASAEGYAFPNNLDIHPPSGHDPPDTHQDLLWRAMNEQWQPEELRHRQDVNLATRAD